MMCFTSQPPCTMAEVWSKETLCTNLSSDGTCLYLWFARKISTLEIYNLISPLWANFIITDNIFPQQVWVGPLTAWKHRPDHLKGAQGKMSILQVGKLSQAICFQWNQIHKLLDPAPASVQLNPMGILQGQFGRKREQAYKYRKQRTKDSIHLSVQVPFESEQQRLGLCKDGFGHVYNPTATGVAKLCSDILIGELPYSVQQPFLLMLNLI